jgi:pimeloyl-ACP methyl ester carboxylesterase
MVGLLVAFGRTRRFSWGRVAVALLLFFALPACRGGASVLYEIDTPSALLAQFLGSPVMMHADVLVPNTYDRDTSRRYPVIYVIHAFGGTYRVNATQELQWQRAVSTTGQEFIVVFLDATCATGEHEFADSANNGPWGTAFTTEFIPAIDARFRTIANPANRFLYGHSSGGWAALWLQVTYPALFAGAWAVSPDPVDFTDFTGPDLTQDPPQNFYHDDNGNEYGFVRVNGHDTTTLRKYVQNGDRSGQVNQFESFDAVFSPRGAGGKPEQLFDHNTGAINASVAAYWETHYDIARILRDRWSHLGPELNGKIHIVVGTADTFHLDGAVRRLQTELQQFGDNADIRFVPGADHWEVLGYHGGGIADAVRAIGRTLASEASHQPGK